ncbi:GIY-YIG nuclease family protein [Empedobacter falsenii]
MNIAEGLELVEQFKHQFRNPNLEDFEVSPIYDLFPDTNTNPQFQKWPEEYQHNGRYGVYFILDSEDTIIYIGKANNIGKRLGNYFKYDSNKNCEIIHENWSKKPKYLLTVAVPNKTWFECLALEEYLIWEISPIDNKRSINF